MPSGSTKKPKAPDDFDARSLNDNRNRGDMSRVEQGFVQTGGVSTTNVHITNQHGPAQETRTLLQALEFPASGLREQTVEEASGGTCEWLLETSEHRCWVASDKEEGYAHRLLWISGKAGSGKSTLMKFAVEEARKRNSVCDEESTENQGPDLVLTHFFSARGSELERSTEGMYRTLLIQLIKTLGHLADALLDSTNGWMPGEGASWPLPSLVRLFGVAVKRLRGRRVIFFVDALDECHDDRVQEMVDSFETLIRETASCGQALRVCFASRPYPYVDADDAVYLTLERCEEHNNDIVNYIEAHLRFGRGSSEYDVRRREEIKEKLLEKCMHVFLWVKLVVGMLNKEFRAGRTYRYNKWLQSSHGDLDELYREMLARDMQTEDEEDGEARVLCFQWVLFALEFQRLEPRQLWWGIQVGMGLGVEEIRQMSEETDDVSVERYISSTSRGLVDTCVQPFSFFGKYVQFIHESAREFVLSDDGPLKQSGARNQQEMELQGHLRLKECCDTLLVHCEPQVLELASRNIWDKDWCEEMMTLEDKYLMLGYACRYILRHADAVQRRQLGGHDQGEWLAGLCLRYQHNLWVLERDDFPRGLTRNNFTAMLTMVDILVIECLDALMGASWPLLLNEARHTRSHRRAPGIRIEGDPLSPLMFALRSRKERETVQHLIDIYLQIETRHATVQNTLQHLADTWKPELDPDSDYYDFLALNLAEESDGLAIFFLVALTPAAATFSDSDAAALQQQANKGFAAVLDFVLERNLSTDYFEFDRSTAPRLLAWAESRGYPNLAATLRSPVCLSRFGFQSSEELERRSMEYLMHPQRGRRIDRALLLVRM